MSAVFVTGTGTEVGKTFVTAALIHALRRRGRSVDALKPVASGFDPAQLGASDTGLLLAALHRPPTEQAIARTSPWRFAAPLSPDMAALREGRRIDFDALLADTRRAVDQTPDVLLIEGIGGLMVPLDERHTVLDWMSGVDARVLLVGGSYLGGISHALTALEILRARRLDTAAMIVSETAGGVDLDETVATIARFAGAVPIIGLPRMPHAEAEHPALQRVIDLF
jgi:dethiobiotin synthetase